MNNSIYIYIEVISIIVANVINKIPAQFHIGKMSVSQSQKIVLIDVKDVVNTMYEILYFENR